MTNKPTLPPLASLADAFIAIRMNLKVLVKLPCDSLTVKTNTKLRETSGTYYIHPDSESEYFRIAYDYDEQLADLLAEYEWGDRGRVETVEAINTLQKPPQLKNKE